MTFDHQRSLLQNVAAISAEFHTHDSYWAFYEIFGELQDGFIGNYNICIKMAEALTSWEEANDGAEAYAHTAMPWIEIVQQYVDTVLKVAVKAEEYPDVHHILAHLGTPEAGAT